TNLNPIAITGSTVGPIANITGSVKIFGTGSAQIAEVLSYAPSGTENAVVTRNIPSGTQAVSASQTTIPWIIAGGVGLTGSTNIIIAISGSTITNTTPIGVTGSFTSTPPQYQAVTGSSVTNTQPVNITGSVLQSGTWTVGVNNNQIIAITGSTITNSQPINIT